jgi:sec-independent protein translocase protein TatA
MGPVGIPELIVIFVVALLVFGPRKLPEIGKSLGKAMKEFQRARSDLMSTLDEEVRKAEYESPRTSQSDTAPKPSSYPPDMGSLTEEETVKAKAKQGF